MKIFFNGWSNGFLDNTVSSVNIECFLELFKNIYNESCEIGNIDDSDILCEFDMLLDCSGTLIRKKKWKHTYVFNSDYTTSCNSEDYDIVLCCEKNHKNVVNVQTFIPYLYSNISIDDKLNIHINEIANDIRCLINKNCWNNISKVYCVNNPLFEADRHIMLKNLFSNHNISSDYIKYISPTYKHTINEETYNKYASKQTVRHLRNFNMTYGELSLILNYKAVLEDIEKKYKGGLFLIFESDVMISSDYHKFNKFMDFIKDKDFDLIHLGKSSYVDDIFNFSLTDGVATGYRKPGENFNKELLDYYLENTKSTRYIEDITNKNDEFRVIRMFTARCTDSFLWNYKGIVKFLKFMNEFEDYSTPLDVYIVEFFEKNIDFKNYWTADNFFKQGSELKLMPSTLR
jgi:hypothetical protein